PDIPHDVHVADVIALPRIDRAAIGRLCHRPLLLRFLPYILDTVPYQKRAGNTSPYQESVRILSESKSVKQGCSLRRKSPISCWEKADAARPGRPGRIMISRSRRPLQVLVALGVVAAALLDPLHAAIAVGRLVGVVLVDAGVHASLAGGLLGVFRIDRIGEYRVAHR